MQTDIEKLQRELAAQQSLVKELTMKSDNLLSRLQESQRLKGHLEVQSTSAMHVRLLRNLCRWRTSSATCPQYAKATKARFEKMQDEISKLREVSAEKQDNLTQSRLAVQELRATLIQRDIELEALKTERADNPINDQELFAAFRQQRDILDSLRNTLTCPLCLDVIQNGEIVSLSCGHTFCQTCMSEWARTSIQNQLQRAQDSFAPYKQITGVECPSCRESLGRSQLKIYLLEEIVRIANRWDPLALPSTSSRLNEEQIQSEMAPEILQPRHSSRYSVQTTPRLE